MSGPRTLSGVVRLRDATPTPGTLSVKVEDVSRADAAARIVAEAIVRLERPLSAGATIPFSVTIPDVSEGIRYNVRAHIDCTGSRQISAGDLISTQAYPVITQGHADSVIVEVEAV
jgi:uncharacterized lipoprotein YbaY